jgi:hypothetical protein
MSVWCMNIGTMNATQGTSINFYFLHGCEQIARCIALWGLEHLGRETTLPLCRECRLTSVSHIFIFKDIRLIETINDKRTFLESTLFTVSSQSSCPMSTDAFKAHFIFHILP